ncbi:hypothetical protein FQA39_LY19016 [Lamprigera yunnana]|nr:hypothetical protein FQA39_LY04551 [Lamprigera yunnana]KAF5304188.1 hypothetical protein FQA39_LY19016 [Lamprigera yunnana]
MATAKLYAALAQLNGLDAVSSSGAQETKDRRAAVLVHLGNLFAQIIHPPELPTFSVDRRENINGFLNNMERHFVLCSILEDQQLLALAKQLRGEAAMLWADYQYFVTGYDEFVQALFEDFATRQAWSDRQSENDNDSSTDATVALPTTRAAEDEVLVKEEHPVDFNNEDPLENDHDDNTQEEEPEQTTAAEKEKSPAEAENDEVGE